MFKTFFSILAFLTATTVYADAVIFSGNDVKTLKPNIDLFGQGKILSGTIDPSSVATSAPAGSIYLNTSNGNLYRKVDAGSSTNWQKVGSAGVAGSIVPNPDWETGTSGWTASAGSYARTTTAADVAFGAGSGSFDASAASQTLTSTAVSIPTGLYANNGLASCSFKTAATDYLLQVYDGTNVLVSTTIPASTQYQKLSANFIFPSSGSLSLRISSQSNAAILYMDDCYLGSASNLTNVSQAQFMGSIRASGLSAPWSSTGTGLQDFAPIASVTYTTAGQALAPSTNIPAIRFTNLPPGTYYVTFRASMQQGASSGQCYFKLWDGSNYMSTDALTGAANQYAPDTLVGVATYSTAQSDITFRLRLRDQTVSSNCRVSQSGWNDEQMQIQVYRFPSTSELALRSDQFRDTIGEVFYVAQSVCPAGSIAADGSAVSRTTYAQLFNRTGTTFGAGDGSTTFNVPDLRGIFVRGTGSQTVSGTTYSGTLGTKQDDRMQGHRHSMDIANDGGGLLSTRNYILGYTNPGGSSTGPWGQPAGQGIKDPTSDGTNGTPRTGSETRPANIALTACISTVTAQAPILVGSVTSSSAGAERVERALMSGICSSGTCSLTSSTPGISSITYSSTGVYSVSFAAGTFSGTPSCHCNDQINPSTCSVTGATSSSAIMRAYQVSPAGYVNASLNITCMGPR